MSHIFATLAMATIAYELKCSFTLGEILALFRRYVPYRNELRRHESQC